MVARGELHLSGIHRLKTHLTEDNHREVLAEAKHKTLKEIERLVARLSSRLRALSVRAPSAPAAPPLPDETAQANRSEPTLFDARAVSAPVPPPRSPDPRPLSPRR